MGKPKLFVLAMGQIDDLVKKEALVGFNQDQRITSGHKSQDKNGMASTKDDIFKAIYSE